MTDAIDLTTAQRKTLSKLLRRFLPGVAVWAYGSRVKWTARPNSDLDLVAFTTPAQRPQVAELKDALAESNLPFPVDLHVWDEVPERFREIIRKEYVVVKEPGGKNGMAGESPIEYDLRWPVVSLAEIAIKIGSGATPKGGADAYLPSRARFALVRSQNVFDRRFDYNGLAFISDEQADGLRSVILQPNDILLNITGDGITFGRACMVPKDVLPACVNQHVSIIRLDPQRADAGYVLAFLTHPEVKSYIESFNAGGSRRAVTKGHIESFRLPLPPLQEQRAIAHILGTLDDKIELNRRMNETLEAIARALFHSWFVAFDPVWRNMARKGRGQPSPGLRPPSPSGRGAGGEGAKHEGEGSKHYRGGYDFTGLVQTARALRKAQTSAEDLFWELVRDRRLMGLKFRRQHQVGDYIADFYCHEHRLVIELDGGIHSEKRKKDHKRSAWMKAQGFTVLRFRNEQLFDDPEAVLRAIAQVAEGASDLPPRPLGEGRGEGSVEELDRLFPNSFEDSELGEIPKGWEVGTIGAMADVIDCLHSRKPERRESGLPLLQLSNIRDDGLIDMQDTYLIGEADYQKWVSRMEASPGDCVITNVGRVGAVAQMPANQKAALGRNMTGIRCKPTCPYPTFLIECLLSQAMKDEIALKMDTGTILDALNVRNIPRLRFSRPRTPDVMECFERKAKPLRAQMEWNLAASQTLAALRDTLLPKLISGELRVNVGGLHSEEKTR